LSAKVEYTICAKAERFRTFSSAYMLACPTAEGVYQTLPQ